jgi:Flp pilus assembly CpaE family ATPase
VSAPVRLALGLENPRLLAVVVGSIDDAETGSAASFRVAGRPCTVTRLCGSVRDLQAAVASPETDALLVSSLLHAIPLHELRALAEAATGRMVVLAPDRAAPDWDGFPATVLEAEPSRAELLDALEQAVLGRAPGRAPRRPRAAATPGTPRLAQTASSAADAGGRLHVVTSVSSDGATTMAAALAFAIGMVARTVALDANWAHGSDLEYHFGADPELNACLLAREPRPKTDAEWTAALRSELQPAGAPSRTDVLCGVTRLSLRSYLSPDFVQRLLVELRRRYQYVFADTSGLGWAPDDPPLDRLTLESADQVLLVVRADEQGVSRATRALLDWPHRERMGVILNIAGGPGAETAREVEQALKAPVLAVVPTDTRGVAAARGRNRPIVCQPGCRAARPTLELARRLVGREPLAMPVDARPAGVGWRRLVAPVLSLLD